MGGMSWGSDKWQGWVMNEDKALPLLEYAWKKGINTWDTVRCSFPSTTDCHDLNLLAPYLSSAVSINSRQLCSLCFRHC